MGIYGGGYRDRGPLPVWAIHFDNFNGGDLAAQKSWTAGDLSDSGGTLQVASTDDGTVLFAATGDRADAKHPTALQNVNFNDPWTLLVEAQYNRQVTVMENSLSLFLGDVTVPAGYCAFEFNQPDLIAAPVDQIQAQYVSPQLDHTEVNNRPMPWGRWNELRCVHAGGGVLRSYANGVLLGEWNNAGQPLNLTGSNLDVLIWCAVDEPAWFLRKMEFYETAALF